MVIVSPTMTPIERALTRTLRMGIRLLGHREGDGDARAAAFAHRDLGLAAKLHGEAADQRQAKAAAGTRGDRAAGARGIVLDDELDHAGLVAGLDADLRARDAVEAAVERAAHGLGHDQADGNGDIWSDRHDGSANMIAQLRQVATAPANRDLPHEIADELLEIDQRPARPLVEVTVQD